MGKLLVWLLAAGKMGKLLTTGGSMLVSMLVYTWVFGWHPLRRRMDRAQGVAA